MRISKRALTSPVAKSARTTPWWGCRLRARTTRAASSARRTSPRRATPGAAASGGAPRPERACERRSERRSERAQRAPQRAPQRRRRDAAATQLAGGGIPTEHGRASLESVPGTSSRPRKGYHGVAVPDCRTTAACELVQSFSGCLPLQRAQFYRHCFFQVGFHLKKREQSRAPQVPSPPDVPGRRPGRVHAGAPRAPCLGPRGARVRPIGVQVQAPRGTLGRRSELDGSLDFDTT